MGKVSHSTPLYSFSHIHGNQFFFKISKMDMDREAIKYKNIIKKYFSIYIKSQKIKSEKFTLFKKYPSKCGLCPA